MSKDSIRHSRRDVRHALGDDLERKASDAFCIALSRSAGGFGLESAASGAPNLHAVVEFSPTAAAAPDVSEAVSRLHGSPGLAEVMEAVRTTVRAGSDTRLAERAEVLASASTLVRELAVRDSRERFYEAVGALRGELERSVAALFALRAEAMGGAAAWASPTQVCWLNRTLRTQTDARALAGIAADPLVARIDLPRRLNPDIGTSGATVGAVGFRTSTSRTGKGIIIAVLDSEIARTHSAFGTRVIHRENYTLEPWGNPGSHGTAVAGIIAADGTLTGIAPEATIYNYKVLAANRFLNADDFGGSLAIQTALEDGAHVANCSWGAGPASDGSSREARACDVAWSLGMVVVKSAGNRGPADGTMTTPADAKGVFAVGATDRDGTSLQDYSSRGMPGGPAPHLLAPGGTPGRGVDSCDLTGGFGDCGHGTSFAAPHVTGLVALLLQGEPDLTPDQLRDRLLDHCTAFPGVPVHHQGRGLVSLW